MYSPEFVKNFKAERPLTTEERNQQLKQRERLTEFDETIPHYELAIIQQNNTFIELTDRNYSVRGIGSAITGFFIIILSWFIAAIWMETINEWGDEFHSGRILTVFFMSIFGGLAVCVLIWFFLRESFTYTHFPLRLNRKNRMVYVWRRDGTVLSTPWDTLFFQLRGYSDAGGKTYDILGHVLESDGNTVKETFAFSSYSSTDAKDLREHFEYFRRYMENGPEQPHRMLKICLPIAKRRETWWEGFMRLLLNMNGWPLFQIIFSPFYFICSLGRWVAMRTSRIPQWPQWVEQECAIDVDDPYRRDSGWEAAKESAGESAAA